MALVLRLAAAAGAAVVCAWFVLGARQAHDTAHAQAVISAADSVPRRQAKPVSPQEAQRLYSMLHSAGVLNPDRMVDVLRARLDVLQNDRPAAVRILRNVVRHEPENIVAWVWFAQATRSLPEIRLAVANIARLDPLAAPGR